MTVIGERTCAGGGYAMKKLFHGCIFLNGGLARRRQNLTAAAGRCTRLDTSELLCV
jgi:hypothetical protein